MNDARKLLCLLLIAFMALGVNAEERVERPVTQVYMLETGGKSVLDTYLSPLRYHGVNVALAGRWSKALPWMDNTWVMRFDSRFGLSRTLNPAKTAQMLGFDAGFAWGTGWTVRFPAGIRIMAGASAGINAGAFYLPRNSNNPVSVKADAGISLTASAAYPFRIGKLPVLVSDEVSLPTLSVFFSPQYGETYYEIYLGNRSGLAHCGWWGNRFSVDNLLSFDFDIGPSALRLGYRYSLGTSWICHINTQVHTHSFVVGWIPHGIGLRRARPSTDALIINSLY